MARPKKKKGGPAEPTPPDVATPAPAAVLPPEPTVVSGRLNQTLRQMADQIENLIRAKGRATNQLLASMRGTDPTRAQQAISSDLHITLLHVCLQERRSTLQQLAPLHPAYEWAMGVPGINLFLFCKLVGLICMDGPHCLSCGEQDIPINRDVLVCWGCHQTPPANAKLGDACPAKLLDPLTSKEKKCGRPLTFSKFLRRCPKCGHMQHDFPTFSQLRKYSGHCPGHNRLVPGQPSEFSKRLRTYSYQAFASLLKIGSKIQKDRRAPGAKPNPKHPQAFYVTNYENWRLNYAKLHGAGPQGLARFERMGLLEEHKIEPYKVMLSKETKSEKTGRVSTRKYPEWPDLRQHLASKNKLLDVFLFHLWEAWRIKAGWPVSEPYIIGKDGGHHTRFDRHDFSSPIMFEEKHKKAEAEARKLRKQLAGLPLIAASDLVKTNYSLDDVEVDEDEDGEPFDPDEFGEDAA